MLIHFIAIGGSAMHNLAIALSKKGYRVTGSDDAIFEPSWSRLNQHGLLPAVMGWDPDRIRPELDAVVLGMHARSDNPELLRAIELGIRIYSYPEYVYEQSKDKVRVVIGGSHGKTTITSMILHVMKACGLDFDYLVGAQLDGFDTMVKITEAAPVMIIEGDEYLASPIDPRPKFHLYKANIGVISGIAWDHINVFPTFQDYLAQFDLFLNTIVSGGTVIYSHEDPEVRRLVENSGAPIEKVPYETPEFSVANGVTSLVTATGSVPLQIFGRHNLMNLHAAKDVCGKLGINGERFYQAIGSFKGAARRLEVIASDAAVTVFKDFAHSPSKLLATIDAVKEQYPDRELVAVFELHTFSSLNRNFLSEYHDTMTLADLPIVFIDQHALEQKRMEPVEEEQIMDAFGNSRLMFFNSSEILEGFLRSINYKGKNLLLMSSGNFGGMNLATLARSAIESAR